LWPMQRVDEGALLAAAASRGVGVYLLSPYYLKRPVRTGILLGYSRMTESAIQEGMRRLSKVL
jgi:GntR family transcriptional regulator / MocR family aminotransferase